ncbi:MAG TPA: tripartite tricarboxylate transporter substrate binding protein [Usitatibacter sp.]|jgi:tripartite-type tricarboxylate transporter receptor subunit TctC|nr:tripartite tricarboxylate transporter substrate binding protein [Usitatibacter sp.]
MKRIAAALFALATGLAFAQYPTKPVTVIVPWPAGGPSDLAARPLGKGLSDALGKPMVIDNRGGASGNIGTALVAKSPPDGYTLLITSSAPIVINPNVFKSMPFDAQKDLVGITNVLRVPLVLAVHPSLGVKDLKGLMAWIDKNKDKAQYASAGNGTPQHMTGELFKTAANLKGLTHVPYKGSAPAITDAIGGHVPMVWDSTIAILSQLKEKKLIPIAVTSAKRHPALPDVPTFAEAGLKGVESYAWYGFFAPAKTPKEVVTRLNAEAVKVMKGPDFARVLQETGSDYVGDTPENFAKFISAEHAKWAKVAKDSGATLD